MLFTAFALMPNDFSRTALGTPVSNTWFAVKKNPGFCEVRVLNVTAVSFPTFSWKCWVPFGKIVRSPTCRVEAYKTLSSLMKPV